MIVINIILSILFSCKSQVFDLNISKGPESYGAVLVQDFRDNILKEPAEKCVKILSNLCENDPKDFSKLLELLKDTKFLKEIFCKVERQQKDLQNHLYRVFNRIYLRGFGQYPIQKLWSDFVKCVCYDLNGRLEEVNDESLYIDIFKKAIKTKPIFLVDGTVQILYQDYQHVDSLETAEDINKAIEKITGIKIFLGGKNGVGINEILEKVGYILSLISQEELVSVEEDKKMIVEIIKQISFVYAKLKLIDEKSDSQAIFIDQMNKFLWKSLPCLENNFLDSISFDQERKVGSFLDVVSSRFKIGQNQETIRKFLLNHLDLQDKNSLRKYCKKLVRIFPICFLAGKYMGVILDVKIQTLKDLFSLFLENVAKTEAGWSFFDPTSWFNKETAINDLFWLLSDFLSIKDLPIYALHDGKLIHQYLAVKHPEHLVRFICNLQDSLDDGATKDSIFNLVGFSRLPNFGIILLNVHGISKFREIERELSLQGDLLIRCAENDPIMMFVELFKKYFVDYKNDLEFQISSILNDYCERLFARYSNNLELQEFNLFIRLYNQLILDQESELDNYIAHIKEYILYPYERLVDRWDVDYKRFTGKNVSKSEVKDYIHLSQLSNGKPKID